MRNRQSERDGALPIMSTTHTPEPWPSFELPTTDDRFETNVTMPLVDYQRASKVVNALAGITDPDEALRSAREALEAVSETMSSRNQYLPVLTKAKVREALALLTPTPSES